MNDGGFHQAQENNGRRMLLYLGAVAAFVFVGAIAKPVFQAVFHPHWTPEQMEAEFRRDPGFGDIFVALKENYPADARALAAQAAADATRDGPQAAGRKAFQFLRRFMRSKADALTGAPADQLHRVAQEYSALMHVLRMGDSGLCGRVVMDGFRPSDHPPPTALEHLSRIGAMQIQAAHAGEVAGRAAQRRPSDRELRAFGAAVAANDPAVAALLGNEAAIRAATPDRQCDLGVALYDAAAELPLESSANVTALLIRESLSQ